MLFTLRLNQMMAMGLAKNDHCLHTGITDVYTTLHPQSTQMLKWYLISEWTMVSLNLTDYCYYIYYVIKHTKMIGRFHPFYRPRRPLGRVEV
jgi:hypothetical protein